MPHTILTLKANLLVVIWGISAGLAGFSIIAMVCLLLLRLIEDRRQRINGERKRILTLLTLMYLDGQLQEEKIRQEFNAADLNILYSIMSGLSADSRHTARMRADIHLLREIVQDLLGSLRGDSRDRLIALLRQTAAKELCLSDLRHKSIQTRIEAVETLSLIPDPEVIEALRRQLDDREPHVRLAVAKALVGMGDYLTIDELVEKLDIGITTRSRVLRDIFQQFSARNPDSLVHLLDRNSPDLVAVLALYGLGKTQDFSMIPVIAGCADWPSVDVRAEAMRALMAIGHPAAEPAVLKGLRDDAWEVRTEAAICAGRIPLPSAVPVLRELLTDEVW